jgi:hypothetical protein
MNKVRAFHVPRSLHLHPWATNPYELSTGCVLEPNKDEPYAGQIVLQEGGATTARKLEQWSSECNKRATWPVTSPTNCILKKPHAIFSSSNTKPILFRFVTKPDYFENLAL